MKELASLREEIDQLDTQLWEIIGKRVDVAREIGEWKRLHEVQVIQPERFQQVKKQCLAHAQQYGLSEALVNEVMETLHKESIKVESIQ